MRNLEQEIRELVLSNPKGWIRVISSRREYMEFLSKKYPHLHSPFYKLSTKIYWLIHGLEDFPVCPTCGKSDNYKTKNVDAGGYPGHCCCRCTQLDKNVRDKNEATNMRLYKVKNGAQSEQSKAKYRKRCQELWGVDNAFQAEEVKEKIKVRLVENYGEDNPMKVPELRAKARRTFVDRYHVSSSFQLAPCVRSKGEIELAEFIIGLFGKDKVVVSDKVAIAPFELDIWIPCYSIGIEYDGDYWHSLPAMVKRDKVKDEICRRKDIQLYRVKECDWMNSKYSVKDFFEKLKRGIQNE